MFIPNSRGTLYPLTGMNGDGEPVYGPGQVVRCAIAALNETVMATALGVQISATHGSSEETALKSEIIFPSTIKLKIDDKFSVAGFNMRVTSIGPRYNVAGQLDHYEVNLLTLVQ
jgi:hypothetical protein